MRKPNRLAVRGAAMVDGYLVIVDGGRGWRAEPMRLRRRGQIGI